MEDNPEYNNEYCLLSIFENLVTLTIISTLDFRPFQITLKPLIEGVGEMMPLFYSYLIFNHKKQSDKFSATT